MSTLSNDLKQELEAAALALGIAPSTIGERAGQGGKFYERLCEGKRIWPETAEKVRSRLAAMIANVAGENQVSNPSDVAPVPGAGVEGSLPEHKRANERAAIQGAGGEKVKGGAV